MTHRTVRDVMTREVVSIREGAAWKEVAELLDSGNISALPVVDAAGRVTGVVSEADLLHKLTYAAERAEGPRLFHLHRLDHTKAAGVVASDVMTSPAITVTPEASIVEAATRMERHGVKRLPVADSAGYLVGVVSRRDLVATFVRPDEDIRAEVRHEVFDRAMMYAEPRATVEVHEGVVTLSGELERRSDVRIAVAVAGRVDGVVDVVNRLGYAFDDTDVRVLRVETSQPGGRFF
jgi:CBS domain-containing protein